MSKKSEALKAVGEYLQKLSDCYGKLDSGDSYFRVLKQQVDDALEEPDAEPQPAQQVEPGIKDLIAAVNDKLDGMEDALAAIIHGLPAA